MPTYTVFTADDSSNPRRGLSLEEAAIALMEHDGHEWDIRKHQNRYGPVWQIWVSLFSKNSPAGGRALVVSKYLSVADTEEDARADLFAQVVRDRWHRAEAMTDEAFDRMLTEATADCDDA